jgi:hypothetical protein
MEKTMIKVRDDPDISNSIDPRDKLGEQEDIYFPGARICVKISEEIYWCICPRKRQKRLTINSPTEYRVLVIQIRGSRGG